MTTTGKITLKASNFGGYLVVENAGLGIKGAHTATMKFLEANRSHFDHLRDGRGYPVLAIKAERAAKFIPYCAAHGIEVGA